MRETSSEGRSPDSKLAGVGQSSSFASVLALALALAVFILGARFGSRTAAGSDAYGYVSQADLWLHGNLHVDQPWVARFAWPDADAVFAPLAYRPGTTPHTLVPTYPPGLPLLMAAFSLPGAHGARYLVVPLMAALGVWLTWRLGRRALGDAGGLLSALLLASSPAFLFQLMLPMSDIPATTAWLAAAVLVLCAPPRPWLAGLAACAAILIRPNLAPLAAVLTVAILLTPADATRSRSPWFLRAWFSAVRLGRAVRFASAAATGVAIYAAFNAALYGSPLHSGYGGFTELLTLHDPGGTLRHYLRLLFETQTILIALAPLGLIVVRGRAGETAALRVVLGGTVAVVLGFYAFYARFEEWWYLRFLLPAYPALIVSSLVGLRWVTGAVPKLRGAKLPASAQSATARPRRSLGEGGQLCLQIAACLLVAFTGWRIAIDRGIFGIQRVESRYERVAAAVRRLTPPNAAIICMQHSGALRYYASRVTLRYDILAPDWLDRAVKDLAGAGYRPYILLEDWEIGRFRDRFAGRSPLGHLDWSPIVRLWPGPAVFLYDAEGERVPAPPSSSP